jgi:hypothetical protein
MNSNHHFKKPAYTPDFLGLAKLRYRDCQIRAYGRWAVVDPGVVTLYEYRADAEKQGRVIVDLAQTPVIDTCRDTDERR